LNRSSTFVNDQILLPLEKKISDNQVLKYISAYCEYGAVEITYSDVGTKNIIVNQQISIPDQIQTEIKELICKPPYKDVMFFDVTKQTMITIELNPGKTIAQFQEPQKQLQQELYALLSKYNLEKDFRIEATTITTDIENIQVGKAFGVRKFIDLLFKQKIEPKEYICFGDSLSDIAMLKELKHLNKNVVFVYVGDKNNIANENITSIFFTSQPHDKGTLEYLQNNKFI